MAPKGRLGRYRKRRDFDRSPEPSGKGRSKRSSTKMPIFVIQEHDARNLHFDFRLEVDGVLVSWAVPKGPSTDPRETRLAVRTEDHPLDYADFEGTIPEGEYGGGKVIVWDTGPYRNLRADKRDEDAEEAEEPEDAEEPEKTVSMTKSLGEGKVEVWLEGQKLRGGYVLIHTRMRGDERNWILKKMDDDEADARRNPVSTEPRSVKSGKRLEDL